MVSLKVYCYKGDRRFLIERRDQGPEFLLFKLTEDLFRNGVSGLMDPAVLPDQPSRQGTPDIFDVIDPAGAEKVLFYEANGVLNRAFAFRVSFITDPELQFLFCTEIFEDAGLDDFAE